MKWCRNIAAGITASALAYIALTWFYFGSPHPCSIATRVMEWEAGQFPDEKWLGFARAIAILNLSRTNLEQSEKDRLLKKLETAPPEEVREYLQPDFTPETILRDAIEKTKNDTPASCVEILYIRLKNRLLTTGGSAPPSPARDPAE